jgi:integrase
MRRGELFKLRWEDVDFERGFIHIRDPKGGQDQVIPLNDAARSCLRRTPKRAWKSTLRRPIANTFLRAVKEKRGRTSITR